MLKKKGGGAAAGTAVNLQLLALALLRRGEGVCDVTLTVCFCCSEVFARLPREKWTLQQAQRVPVSILYIISICISTLHVSLGS